jgi:formate-dependent nitrite reductase cytochrome c552 subunit
MFTDFAFSGVKSPVDPCLECHTRETPKVVSQWKEGKHSKTGVKCYVCHFAEADNTDGMEHNGFFVVTDMSEATCESCHPEDGAALRKNFSMENGMHP